MMKDVLVSKDEDNQHPIPTAWKKTFCAIVDAMKDGDFRLDSKVVGVSSISAADANRMANNIKSYGAHLASLTEESWHTSVCQWMRGYWDVLIDLVTIEEGISDLVLAVRVYEKGTAYDFEVQSIHVP